MKKIQEHLGLVFLIIIAIFAVAIGGYFTLRKGVFIGDDFYYKVRAQTYLHGLCNKNHPQIKTPFRSVKYPPIATAKMAIIIKKTSPKCSWIFFISVLLLFKKKPFSPAKMASEILLLIFKINTADHVTVDDLCPLFRGLDLHPLRIHVHQFSFDTTHIIKINLSASLSLCCNWRP